MYSKQPHREGEGGEEKGGEKFSTSGWEWDGREEGWGFDGMKWYNHLNPLSFLLKFCQEFNICSVYELYLAIVQFLSSELTVYIQRLYSFSRRLYSFYPANLQFISSDFTVLAGDCTVFIQRLYSFSRRLYSFKRRLYSFKWRLYSLCPTTEQFYPATLKFLSSDCTV